MRLAQHVLYSRSHLPVPRWSLFYVEEHPRLERLRKKSVFDDI